MLFLSIAKILSTLIFGFYFLTRGDQFAMDMSLDSPAVNKELMFAVLKMLCLIIDLKYSLAFDLS
jgi:hypothetical protein